MGKQVGILGGKKPVTLDTLEKEFNNLAEGYEVWKDPAMCLKMMKNLHQQISLLKFYTGAE